ncbi:MAG TPA: ribosome small subunit-dependent GTPase A [Armatimonadota bacterium]
MKFQEKKRFQVLLNALSEHDRAQLRTRAEVERKEIMGQRKGALSLDEAMLHLLERARATPESAPTEAEAKFTGLVVGLSRRHASVQSADEEERTAPLAPALAQAQKSAIAVGDRVHLSGDPLQVTTVLPRRTRLSRPDPGSPHIERVLAANIDVVAVVTATKLPPMRPRLLDRALLAIEQGGALPILVATKIDLLTEEERARELARYDAYITRGIPVVPCSSATGEGLPALRAALADRTCVLVGNSGVGKSSLLNALDPALTLPTRELHKGSGQGRHTTTASRLYRLEGNIRLIDTPGVRAFGIWKMTEAEIRVYFHEFTDLEDGCAFNNCSHTHEPRCAVKDAVHAGDILPERYAAYVRLLGDDDEGKG